MSDSRQVFTVTPAEGEEHVLILEGELDMATVHVLQEALASRNGGRPTTLDVSDLTFIDSTGLHAFVTDARSREPDGALTLKGVSPNLMRLLEITQLVRLPSLRIDGRA